MKWDRAGPRGRPRFHYVDHRLPDFEKRNAVSNQEHREIVAAILDKDADRAVGILTGHLTRNYGTYFRLAMEQKSGFRTANFWMPTNLYSKPNCFTSLSGTC